MEDFNDINELDDGAVIADSPAQDNQTEASPSEKALVKKILLRISDDKRHFDKKFKRMKTDMELARTGRHEGWASTSYVANFIGRHVKQKTAALYAKNPKVVARRRETLDFEMWDEKLPSLQMAMQVVQQAAMAAQMAAAQPAQTDPQTGMAVAPEPQLPPGFEQAQALMADVQQGLARRDMLDKIGKTLEVLFAHFTRAQQPVDFKTALKRLVRRTSITGVGYIELGFQREYGPRDGATDELNDFRARLDHLRRLSDELGGGHINENDAEMAEIQHAISAIEAEEEVITREGLIFDFVQSTKLIPDKQLVSIVGFTGARWISIEYTYTPDEVQEIFQVDVRRGSSDRLTTDFDDGTALVVKDAVDDASAGTRDLVKVWKHYDKTAGLVYYVAEGHDEFLRPPAAPDVFVETFWPVYALTFNDLEHESEPYPVSDVELLESQQAEYNRARQGMREHRDARRPRWAVKRGVLDDEDIDAIGKAKPFSVTPLNLPTEQKLSDVFEAFPVPGVDPNLYETNQIFTDAQIVAGSQEAQYGGVAKATATESAIAANSMAATDNSAVDDLDSFLSPVVRGAGQILLREMSEETVKQIAGPGAIWPHATLEEIANELYLEVEAGSSGKPNQAVEIQNMKDLLPLLLQIPNIDPVELARESLRRLDDKLDLTKIVISGLPAIVAMNRMQQPAPANPANDPAAQGDQGVDNGPQPPGQVGTEPAFGSNQV